MVKYLLALLISSTNILFAQKDSVSNKIPADLFFEKNLKSQFCMSQDGQLYAEIFEDNNSFKLRIIDIDDYVVLETIPLSDKKIYNLNWLNTNTLIFETYGRIYVIDKDGSNMRMLAGNIDYENSSSNFSKKIRFTEILHLLPEKEDEILIEAHDFYGYSNVEKLNLFTGERTVVANGRDNDMNTWFIGPKGRVRLGAKLTEEGFEYFQKDYHYDEMQPVKFQINSKHYSMDTKGKSIMNRELSLEEFGYDENVVYLNSTIDSDKRILIKYDLQKRVVIDTIMKDATYDVGNFYGNDLKLFFNNDTQSLAGLRFEAMTPSYKWFDANYEKAHNILLNKYSAYFHDFIGVDDSRETFLVHQWSERRPGNIGVLKTKDSSYTVMAVVNEELSKYNLTSVRPFVFKTRDSAQVSGYINLPDDYAKGKPVPLVVIPHGGPWARDYFNLDGFSQYFANRGYVTLRVNFRGSIGFGKKFLEAGVGGLDSVMIDDIIDGTKAAISSYQIDASNVFIFGHSYGGYAAYMSLIRYPGIFNSAVILSAPTDLKLAMKEMKQEDIRFGYDFWNTALGDKNNKYLKEISPINYASKLNAPMLIVHGRFDETVSLSQAENMEEALKANNKDVELRIIENVGHSLEDSKSMGYILEMSDQFFEEHTDSNSAKTISGK